MTAPVEIARTLSDASLVLDRMGRAMAVLAIEICARRFEVEAGDVARAEPFDRRSPYRRRVELARACAMSLLHTGAGWTQEAVAGAFDLAHRRSVSKAVARVADARDTDRDLDDWLDSLERMMGEA